MKIQYVADDGTVFFEAKECTAYEKSLNESSIKNSRFWAGSKKPMSIEEFCDNPGNCDFIEVAKGEEEAVYRVLDKGGVTDPWGGYRLTSGRYYYSWENDEWCDYNVIEEEYLSVKKIFEGE